MRNNTQTGFSLKAYKIMPVPKKEFMEAKNNHLKVFRVLKVWNQFGNRCQFQRQF